MGSGCGGAGVGGGGEIIYRSLHFHHQIDSCIKMGSDESHFNVSLIVRDKVARQCSAEAESNRGPSAYQPNALPLGQTGSRLVLSDTASLLPSLLSALCSADITVRVFCHYVAMYCF